MNNKLQNFFLGTLIVAGIVLCAVLFASESSSKAGNGAGTKNTQSPSGSTAAIINDVKEKFYIEGFALSDDEEKN